MAGIGLQIAKGDYTPQELRAIANDYESNPPPAAQKTDAGFGLGNLLQAGGNADRAPAPDILTEAQNDAPKVAAPSGQPDSVFFSPEVDHVRSIFRDPKALQQIAIAAFEHDQPSAMQWLQRGYLAEKENAIESMQRLIAGDKKGALASFNSTGRDKAVAIEDAGAGSYKVRFEDGTSRVVEPRKELMSLMPPAVAMKMEKELKELEARTTHYQNQDKRDQRRLGIEEEDRAERRRITEQNSRWGHEDRQRRIAAEEEAKAAAAENKKAAAAAKEEADKAKAADKEEANALKADEQVYKTIRDSYPTDELGKKKSSALLPLVPSIKADARKMARDQNIPYPEAAAIAARDEISRADRIGSELKDASVAQAKSGGTWSSVGRAFGIGSGTGSELADAIRKQIDVGVPVDRLRRYAEHGGVDMGEFDRALAESRKPTEKKEAPKAQSASPSVMDSAKPAAAPEKRVIRYDANGNRI